jgi:hypothetical protein
MSQADSPFQRSINLSAVIRGLLAAGAVIAVGAGIARGYYALAIAGAVFFAAAIVLGIRARRAADAVAPPRSP